MKLHNVIQVGHLRYIILLLFSFNTKLSCSSLFLLCFFTLLQLFLIAVLAIDLEVDIKFIASKLPPPILQILYNLRSYQPADVAARPLSFTPKMNTDNLVISYNRGTALPRKCLDLISDSICRANRPHRSLFGKPILNQSYSHFFVT